MVHIWGPLCARYGSPVKIALFLIVEKYLCVKQEREIESQRWIEKGSPTSSCHHHSNQLNFTQEEPESGVCVFTDASVSA